MKTKQILKTAGKWTGFILLGIFVLASCIYAYASIQFNKVEGTKMSYSFIDISIPSDSMALIRGKHLYTVYNCKECHTDNLAGKVMINDPMFGYVKTANLTKGKGGLPADFTDQDWLMVLKHGINKEGKPLVIMPFEESSRIPDKDLAEIIAYCKSVPAVNNDLGEQKLQPLAKILFAFGKVKLFPSLEINHRVTPIAKPEEVISEDYGATLSISCTGCHSMNFGGGPPPAPGFPQVPDISSTGKPGKWTEEQFMNTLRNGITPEGHVLKNEQMPWKNFKEYSDVELKSIREYILTFPKKVASAD